MLSVTAVPLLKEAEPVLPTATLIPAGLEVTLSPLRPLAVTVSVAARAGAGAETGFSVSTADLVTPPPETEIVAAVWVVTAAVEMKKLVEVAPAGIRMAFGGSADALLLVSWNVWSTADGAAMVTTPMEPAEPVTEDGLTVMEA